VILAEALTIAKLEMTTEALFIVTIVELQSVEILAEALIEICQ
jgi:hypothetical protein